MQKQYNDLSPPSKQFPLVLTFHITAMQLSTPRNEHWHSIIKSTTGYLDLTSFSTEVLSLSWDPTHRPTLHSAVTLSSQICDSYLELVFLICTLLKITVALYKSVKVSQFASSGVFLQVDRDYASFSKNVTEVM